jgi:hypothetical protein
MKTAEELLKMQKVSHLFDLIRHGRDKEALQALAVLLRTAREIGERAKTSRYIDEIINES